MWWFNSFGVKMRIGAGLFLFGNLTQSPRKTIKKVELERNLFLLRSGFISYNRKLI